MRAYVAVPWVDLAELSATGSLPGPRAAVVVDPAWRVAAAEVTEEEWEYQAQEMAAEDLAGVGGGVVLAVDADPPGVPVQDGRTVLPGPIARASVGAVLTADLSWYGLQEVPELLGGVGR